MNVKEKLTIIIVIAFIVCGIIFIQYEKKSNFRKRNLFMQEGEMTIGTIESRNYSNGTTYTVSFSFNLSGVEYGNSDGQCYLDSDKAASAFTDRDLADVEDKFIVLFKKDNPDESIIRLDYPIKDSTDFKRYVKEFEKKRKQKINNKNI